MIENDLACRAAELIFKGETYQGKLNLCSDPFRLLLKAKNKTIFHLMRPLLGAAGEV